MGWLGLALGARLVKKGYQLRGSTTREEKMGMIREIGATPYLIQAGPELLLEEVKDFFDCDILIITLPPSAISPGGRRSRSEPDGKFEKTISRILSQWEGGNSPFLIYTSSTSVYGNVNGEVNEDSPTNPVTSSAKMVMQAERVLRDRFDEKTTVFRFGGLVGGKRKPGRFLAGKVGAGKGLAPVNMIHREDCIRAIEEVIEKNAWGNTYNLVAPSHPLRKDYYSEVTQRQGFEPPQFDPADTRTGKAVLSNKIVRDLGFSFTYPNPLDFPE